MPLYVRREVTIKGKTCRRIDKPQSGKLMRKALFLKQPITEEQVLAVMRQLGYVA